MAHLPNPTSQSWNSLVVGGSSGDPVILKLIEENLIINGNFEDAVGAEWSTTGSRINAGANAQRGNYVLQLGNDKYAMQYISNDSYSKVLLTGFCRFTTGASTKFLQITISGQSGTSRVAAPVSNSVKLKIIYDGTIVSGQWVPFYIMADLSTWSSPTYIHFDFLSDSNTVIEIDDLQVYEVSEQVDMNCPNTFNLNWQRLTDAHYEMLDHSIKDYLSGWRAQYSMGYEYCSRAQLVKDIGISENDFNLLIPHSNNLNNEYVRIINDFNSSYFHERYLGHSQELVLEGIFKRKFKNKEYGEDYFEITSN